MTLVLPKFIISAEHGLLKVRLLGLELSNTFYSNFFFFFEKSDKIISFIKHSQLFGQTAFGPESSELNSYFLLYYEILNR